MFGSYGMRQLVILTGQYFVPDAIRLRSVSSQILLEIIILQHRPTLRCLVSDAHGIVKYTARIFCVISLL